MPRGLEDRESGHAEFDYLAVRDDLVHANRPERFPTSEVRIAKSAVVQDRGVAGGRPHQRPGELLDLGERGRVIPVRLRRQQKLDVLQPESQ